MEKEKFVEIRKYINDCKAKMVELETLLTSHPALAPENGGEGELEKAKALVDWLKKEGFAENQIQEIDAPDSRVKSGVRPNVIVTIPGESDDFAGWVMAHLDVVPAGDLKLWHSDPWQVVEKDGKLYGRGVEDNQQGLVSGVFAALAFVKNGINIDRTFEIINGRKISESAPRPSGADQL